MKITKIEAVAMMTEFNKNDKKFRRVCHHIEILNRKIAEMQIRYNKAYTSGKLAFRYSYRLQMATFEGTRNMYNEYATIMADRLEEMQKQLIQKGLISPHHTSQM